MITPAFSITATERVLPKMALDFTTGVLDSRVAVARSGNNATTVNSSGLVEVINANLPRFDYNPSTLACKGLLIEEARTNVILQSTDFSNVLWGKGNATITANQVTAPDGTLTADQFALTASNGEIYQVVTKAASAITYSLSAYVKAGTNTSIRFYLSDNVAGQAVATFNVVNGTFSSVFSGTWSGASASIFDAGNGWYRCVLTATSPANVTALPGFDSLGNGNYCYIWGAQLEAGAYPTSFIPTVASQVTRTADVATMTGTNFSSWYNTSQGTFVVMADKFAINTPLSYIVSTNPTTGCPTMYSRNATAFIEAGLTNVFSLFNTSAITANTMFKAAYGYKQSSHVLSTNAASVSTSSNATAPAACTFLAIGSDGTSSQLNGHVAKINYYSQRLINAEAQSFSKG